MDSLNALVCFLVNTARYGYRPTSKLNILLKLDSTNSTQKGRRSERRLKSRSRTITSIIWETTAFMNEWKVGSVLHFLKNLFLTGSMCNCFGVINTYIFIYLLPWPETTKRPELAVFWFMLPFYQLSTAYSGGFTLFLFNAERQGSCECRFYIIVFDLTWWAIEPESTVSAADVLTSILTVISIKRVIVLGNRDICLFLHLNQPFWASRTLPKRIGLFRLVRLASMTR